MVSLGVSLTNGFVVLFEIIIPYIRYEYKSEYYIIVCIFCDCIKLSWYVFVYVASYASAVFVMG